MSLTIGSICDKVTNIKKDYFENIEVFEYLDISSIDREKKQVIGTTTTVADEAPSRAKQPVITNDVLVSTVRPNLNAVAIVSDKHNGSIASTGFTVLRPNMDKLDPLYLSFFVRTEQFVSHLMRFATGANYPAVSDKIVKNTPIPLPPLPTQKKIVEILDAAQRLIDTRKAQIAEMGALVQSLFYDMFGDPVSNPKGWPIEKIDHLCEEIVDCVNRTAPIVDEKTPFKMIRTTNIRHGRIDTKNVNYVTEETYNKWIRRLKPQKGDILFTREAPMGEAGLVNFDDKVFLGQRVMHYRPNERINPHYLLHHLMDRVMEPQLIKLASGSTVKHLSVVECKKFEICLPPIDLQNTFADHVQKIESQKAAMQSSLSELEDNFNALMQRAFKGELV